MYDHQIQGLNLSRLKPVFFATGICSVLYRFRICKKMYRYPTYLLRYDSKLFPLCTNANFVHLSIFGACQANPQGCTGAVQGWTFSYTTSFLTRGSLPQSFLLRVLLGGWKVRDENLLMRRECTPRKVYHSLLCVWGCHWVQEYPGHDKPSYLDREEGNRVSPAPLNEHVLILPRLMRIWGTITNLN